MDLPWQPDFKMENTGLSSNDGIQLVHNIMNTHNNDSLAQDVRPALISKMTRPSYSKEIRNMMYIFGDCKEPLNKSVSLVEKILRDQMNTLLYKATDAALLRGGTSVSHEDILFLLRKNKTKLKRLMLYLEVKDAKDFILKKSYRRLAGLMKKNVKHRGVRIKNCLDFLNAIDASGELPNIMDEEIEDPVADQRIVRRNLMTLQMSSEEYLSFSEKLRASFLPKRGIQKFRNWLLADNVTPMQPTQLALEIISYLARETVAEIVDLSLQVKKDSFPNQNIAIKENLKASKQEIVDEPIFYESGKCLKDNNFRNQTQPTFSNEISTALHNTQEDEDFEENNMNNGSQSEETSESSSEETGDDDVTGDAMVKDTADNNSNEEMSIADASDEGNSADVSSEDITDEKLTNKFFSDEAGSGAGSYNETNMEGDSYTEEILLEKAPTLHKQMIEKESSEELSGMESSHKVAYGKSVADNAYELVPNDTAFDDNMSDLENSSTHNEENVDADDLGNVARNEITYSAIYSDDISEPTSDEQVSNSNLEQTRGNAWNEAVHDKSSNNSDSIQLSSDDAVSELSPENAASVEKKLGSDSSQSKLSHKRIEVNSNKVATETSEEAVYDKITSDQICTNQRKSDEAIKALSESNEVSDNQFSAEEQDRELSKEQAHQSEISCGDSANYTSSEVTEASSEFTSNKETSDEDIITVHVSERESANDKDLPVLKKIDISLPSMKSAITNIHDKNKYKLNEDPLCSSKNVKSSSNDAVFTRDLHPILEGSSEKNIPVEDATCEISCVGTISEVNQNMDISQDSVIYKEPLKHPIYGEISDGKMAEKAIYSKLLEGSSVLMSKPAEVLHTTRQSSEGWDSIRSDTFLYETLEAFESKLQSDDKMLINEPSRSGVSNAMEAKDFSQTLAANSASDSKVKSLVEASEVMDHSVSIVTINDVDIPMDHEEIIVTQAVTHPKAPEIVKLVRHSETADISPHHTRTVDTSPKSLKETIHKPFDQPEKVPNDQSYAELNTPLEHMNYEKTMIPGIVDEPIMSTDNIHEKLPNSNLFPSTSIVNYSESTFPQNTSSHSYKQLLSNMYCNIPVSNLMSTLNQSEKIEFPVPIFASSHPPADEQANEIEDLQKYSEIEGEPITPGDIKEAVRRYLTPSGPFLFFSMNPKYKDNTRLLCC